VRRVIALVIFVPPQKLSSRAEGEGPFLAP
jgi:hypothetical protein